MIENLYARADCFFDKEAFDDALDLYKQANRLQGSLTLEDVQAQPRYIQKKRAYDEASLAANQCDDKHQLPRLTRIEAWNLADLADFLYSRGLYANALEFYRKAIEILKDEPNILIQCAMCLMHLGKIPRSEDILRLAERRNANPIHKAHACHNIAMMAWKITKTLKEAEASMRKCCKLVPGYLDNTAKLDEIRMLISKMSFLSSSMFNRKPVSHKPEPYADNLNRSHEISK